MKRVLELLEGNIGFGRAGRRLRWAVVGERVRSDLIRLGGGDWVDVYLEDGWLWRTRVVTTPAFLGDGYWVWVGIGGVRFVPLEWVRRVDGWRRHPDFRGVR